MCFLAYFRSLKRRVCTIILDMILQKHYQQLLPVANAVVEQLSHQHYVHFSLREDVLSSAQLNVLEFCNLEYDNFVQADSNLQSGNPSQKAKSVEERCFEFVYNNTQRFFRTERTAAFLKSTNTPLKGKYNETMQLQDALVSNEPSPQSALEDKHAQSEIKKLFSNLPKKQLLIFKSVILNKDSSTEQLAENFHITTAQLKEVVDSVLKKIFDEAGESAYDKYAHAVARANNFRLMTNIKQNWQFLTRKMQEILKSRYVLKMKLCDVAKKFGYLDPKIVGYTKNILKTLATNSPQKEALLARLSKKRAEEDFVSFVKRDKACLLLLASIRPTRRDIFERHYFQNERFPAIAKTYNKSKLRVADICNNVTTLLKKFISSTPQQKQDILSSISRTGKHHAVERADFAMKGIVREFISLKNWQDIVEAFPKSDQIIIRKFLIEGMPASAIAKQTNFATYSIPKRGDLICKKLEVFVRGTEPEKTRALQMLHKNHWMPHKIKDNVALFMKNKNFPKLVKSFPKVDQIILKKYMIEGQLAPDVGKLVNLGKTGVNFRANKISGIIDIINTGTQAEIEKCMRKLKRAYIAKAKPKQDLSKSQKEKT